MTGFGSIDPVVIAATPPRSGGYAGGTTVADLLDGMPNRISDDKIPGIFPAINKALALIAKRLFILESDFAKGDMRMSAFGPVVYPAATISFLPGGDIGQDTIIDTASGFLLAGFKAGMCVKTDSPSNPGPFWIEAVEAGVMTLRPSDRVLAAPEGTDVIISSDPAVALLPADFWGMRSKPAIDGSRYPLNPIPNQSARLYYSGRTGPVQYYELAGDKMTIYPGTSSDVIITGDYWRKPVKLEYMEDVLPFNDLFNDAIEEYLVAVLGGGPMAAVVSTKAILIDSVDLIVKMREIKAPERSTAGINRGGLQE